MGLSDDDSYGSGAFGNEFFPTGDGNPPWEFDYEAGYLPGSTELWDLNSACVERVLWRLQMYLSAGISAERIGGYSKTVDREESSQPFMETFRRFRLQQWARR
jgi:hypothetical protein